MHVQYLDNPNIKVPVTLFILILEITYNNHVVSLTGFQTEQAFAHLKH